MRNKVIVAVCCLVFVACGRIEVLPNPTPPAPATSADLDVAIISIDFDPALQGNRLPLSQSYAVLAAVENRGALTAYNLTVTATLRQQTTSQVVLNGDQTLSELPPGAITVVRMQTDGTLPPQFATYTLLVAVRPLANETIVSNNQRSFTIEVAP